MVNGHGTWQVDDLFEQLNPHEAAERCQEPESRCSVAPVDKENHQYRAGERQVHEGVAQLGHRHESAVAPCRPKRLEKVVNGLVNDHQGVFGQDILQDAQESPAGDKKRQDQKEDQQLFSVSAKEQKEETSFHGTREPATSVDHYLSAKSQAAPFRSSSDTALRHTRMNPHTPETRTKTTTASRVLTAPATESDVPKKTPEQDVFPPVPLKKGLTPLQLLGVTGKGTDLVQALLIVVPQPVADAVTGDRPGHGQQQDRCKSQAPRSRNRPDTEHDHRTGNQQPDQGQRFEK